MVNYYQDVLVIFLNKYPMEANKPTTINTINFLAAINNAKSLANKPAFAAKPPATKPAMP